MAELIGLREFDYKIIRAMGENAGNLAAVAEVLHRSEAELCNRLFQIRAFFDQQQKQPEPETDGEIIVRKLCSMAKLSAMQRAAERLKDAGANVPEFPRAYSAPRQRWTDFR